MPDFNQLKDKIELAYTLTLKGTKPSKLSEQQRDTLLTFMLLFSVFEAELFRDAVKRETKCKEICEDLKHEKWFDIKDYDKFGNFFVERYMKDGKYNDHHLFQGRRDHTDTGRIVQNAIEKLRKREYDDNLFYSYLEIAYRFRNKLFHGEKDALLDVNKQIDSLDKINWLMHKLLSDMVENKFIGLSEKYPKKLRNNTGTTQK